MDDEQFISYLELLDKNELQQVDISSLTPNHAYLFYKVDDEFSGRSIYQNVDAIAGFYTPTSNSRRITLTKVSSVEYSVKGRDVNPLADINRNMDIQHRRKHSITNHDYAIYKLPIAPIKKERIRGMNEAIEELRFVPTDNDTWFIGEKYRAAKKSFERKQRGTRKRSQSKSPKRTTSKSHSKSSSRSRTNSK